MAKRKVDDENRVFNPAKNPAWEMELAFVEIRGKPMSHLSKNDCRFKAS